MGITRTALLRRVKSEIVRIIQLLSSNRMCSIYLTLQPVVSPAIFERNIHGYCSIELPNSLHKTFTYFQHYSFYFTNAKINQNLHFFVPSAGELLNSVLESIF